MADSITYQEIAAAIAAILTRHPQVEKKFNKFERLPWLPAKRGGLMKKTDAGELMVAERNVGTSKIEIVFMVSAELED